MADRVFTVGLQTGVEFEIAPDEELQARGFTTVYRDTIWWSSATYGGNLTNSVLNRLRAGADTKTNALKSQRYANWKAFVLSPPPEPPDDPPVEG